MPTRELITSDDPTVRRYRVRDDAGQEIGTDVEAVRTPRQVNETTIRSRVAALLTPSAAYLALPNPTATQTTAQVQRNARLTIALAKIALGQLDTTDGT